MAKQNEKKSSTPQVQIWMVQALLELMENQPFSSIKISHITEKALVSRCTFYRNFKTKEDVLALHYSTVAHGLTQHVNEKGALSIYATALSILNFGKKILIS